MKTPSIVTGNDFVMKVYVYQPRYIDNNTVMEEFSLRDCSSIKVFLINNADSYCVEYTLDENEDNLLKVVVDFKLPIGSYGLEITGKDSQGKNWRFKAKKGEMFNIIDATSGSDFNNDLLEDGLYVTAKVGILGIDVDDFVTQADLELLSISWNDLTDKPTIPTNMSQLNNDAGYVNDLSNYYTKREVDERDRYATSPMVDIFSDTQHSLIWNTDTIFVHNYNSVEGATLTINASLTGIDTVIINWQYKIVVTVNHHCTYEWITDDVVKLMFDESFTSLDIHNTNGYTFEIYADQGITIREKLQNVETQLNNNYYTKSDIDNAGFITQHQSLADYPTKSDIENASYVTSDYLSQQSYLTQHQSLDNYVTKEDLNNSSYLTEHQDLSSYVTYDYLSSQSYLTQHQSLDNYVTKEDLNNASYITEHQDLSSYVTYDYLSSQSYLTQHQSLDNYVTKSDIDNASYVTSDYLSQQSYLTEHQSLNDYVTKSDLDNASYLTEHQDLSSYVTYDFLSSQSYLTQHQSLDNYVTKSDLDNASYLTEHQDLSSYVTYDFLSSQAYLQQHQDLSSYVTYDYLSAQSYLTQHQSLNGYATESWVNDKFEDILGVDADGISGIKEILEDNDTYTGILKEIVKKANTEDVYTKSDIVNASYVTSDFLSQQSYLQQHQSLDNYVTYDFLSSQSYLTQHQSLDNYVTKEDLNNASYLTEHQDLSSYVTYDYLSSQSYLTQHQSLDNYVTKSDIENASYVTSDYLSQQSYLTEHQSLNDYVTKSDLDNASYLTEHQDLSSYVTYDYLSAQSYLTQHQSLDNYVTKSDLDNASYLTEYQDLSSYVTYDYLSAQSYLTQHQSLDNYVTKSDIENASYVTSDFLSQQSYLTQHQSLDNYVTKSDLDNASYLTEHQDLSSYVTYDYLSAQSYLTEHQDLSSYVTYDYLSAQSYLTQHQSLDNYYTKTEINNAGYLTSHQSLDNYVTKNDLSNAGYLTSIPNTYVTKQQLDECTYINTSGTITESGTYSINNISEFELDVHFNEDEGLHIIFYANNEYYNSVQLYLYSGDSGNTLTDEYFEVNYSLIENYEKEEGDWWYKYRFTCNYPVKSVIVDDGNYNINYSLTYGKSCTVIDNFDYYVSKTDLSNASYITKQQLNDCGYLTSHQSLTNYVTKTILNNCSYVTKQQLSNCGYLTSHQSLSNYPTKTDISNASYLTVEDVSAMGYITSHQDLSDYATKEEISNAGYLTSHQSLDNYYTKSDIQGMSYVSQSELSSMGYLQSHQSLSDYYTKTEINNAGYLTSHQSLSNYVTTTQLDERTLFESTTYSINVTSGGEYILPYKVTELIVQIFEQTSWETINIQTEDLNSVLISFTQYETYPLTNTSGGLSVVTSDLGNGEYKIESNQEIVKFYWMSSTPIEVTITKPEITVKENFNYYVSKEELSNCGYLTSHQSLSNYYTKTQINNMSYVSKSVLSSCSYLTVEDVSAMGYITSHQDLTNYALKSELFSGNYNDLSNKPTIPSEQVFIATTENTVSDISSALSNNKFIYLKYSSSGRDYYLPLISNDTYYYNFGGMIVDRWHSVRLSINSKRWESLSTNYPQTRLSSTNKLDSTYISGLPTKLSDFTNDASYITATELSNCGYLTSHQSLSNYYTKTQINNASYIASSTSGLKIEVVSSLPASPDSNTIYIVQ